MSQDCKKTYMTITFGCQMNERDSETIGGILEEMGFSEGKERKDADVIIINTCSVREHADKRFFGTLGALKKIKLERPEFVVGVCGCMMQQQHIIDEVKTKFPWVDIIFGTHNIHEFPKLISGVLNEKEKQRSIWEDGGEIVEGLPVKRLYKFKASVNIMYGCNNFCTYCIVPYTRGRERSRKSEDILAEIKKLAKDGTKEITLLGQNVNSYVGGENIDFADLIYMINDVEGIERIRFMTSHPKDLSDKLIEAYGKCQNLCDYIHLPVQSGSNRILNKMNRKYTREDYIERIKKLREVSPTIGITTDIIVGFPGETEADFEETIRLIKEIQFDSAYTFLYSVRKGTPAEKFEEQVAEEVKHRRFVELSDTLHEIMAAKNKALEGQVLKVLVEGPSKNNKDIFTGRSEAAKPVNFEGQKSIIGQIVNVKVTESRTFSLIGEIV